MSESAKSAAPASTAFRPRAGEITRLEAFSDGTFAFAITLLVVSLEVPATFDQLLDTMRGFLAFAICFTILLWIWHVHTRFFRRYGLQDAPTVALNGALLFVVLFYVYPLKFLWTLVIGNLTGLRPLGGALEAGQPMMRGMQTPQLMVIYGIGFTAIFLTLAALYYRAYGKRAAMELTPLEVFDTRSAIWEHLGVAAVGVVSIVLSQALPERLSWLSGPAYSLIGVVKGWHGYWHFSARRKLEAQLLPTKKL
jgi:hypothetical protein